ncbi:hypothetical protein [Gemmatimonas sp.]|uniref:hypothetical protein n=1 Tax=Gemmatimonas sp. TaxID=1962908 RepID=UPI003561BCAC
MDSPPPAYKPPAGLAAVTASVPDITTNRHVVVLVPSAESSDPNLDYYNDFSQSHAEYARAFEALGYAWSWQPVTMADFRPILEALAAQARTTRTIVFNLCDGDEVNGVPGISVVRYLDDLRLCYTGADANFYDITTSKISMKQIFDRTNEPTSPWEVLMPGGEDVATASPDRHDIAGIFTRLGTPLIVKPAISAGSMGITVDSVVHTEHALRTQLDALRNGYRGWNLAGGGVLVERFVTGPEYTTFIVGSCDAADACTVYRPVERVFNRALPPTQQFLSFDRLWEIYEREAPIADGEYLWEYATVTSPVAQRVMDVSMAAYASMGGRGYGRVDLRLDADTNELYVLEVNAQCGLSEDENYTSIGAILRFAGVPFGDVVQQIIADAERSHAIRIVPLLGGSSRPAGASS